MSSDKLSILWFRHGLRLHDNPSLHEVIKAKESKVLPIFIFDGECAGTKFKCYNRMGFLLECLEELDQRFQKFGSNLHIFKGQPIEVFESLHKNHGISKLCFDQDPEPIWKKRDEEVKLWCQKQDIECVEKVAHTLWNPQEIVDLNGGKPPVTFSMFNHVVSVIGLPPRPLPDVELSEVSFAKLDTSKEQYLMNHFPVPEDVGVEKELGRDYERVYHGGESNALSHLDKRLSVEFKAFMENSFLPNRRNPELLCPQKSLSPDLKFGSLSIRRFYWGVMDAFKKSQEGTSKPHNPQIVIQLLWREFFYTMSVNNPYYGEMERNEICINIPWYSIDKNDHWNKFCSGKTGYPLIDAGVRQILKEGWVHHIIRNAMACFMTRGDLWISWEDGLTFFSQNLIDFDWAVSSGNWMWISSSAFENVLNCSVCVDPVTYGRRSDPWGDYVKKYLPELANYPVEYIYEPWTAPIEVQEKAKCIIGKDYPERIVIHEEVSVQNSKMMNDIKDKLLQELNKVPTHVMPSNEGEIRQFMAFSECCDSHKTSALKSTSA